MSNHGFFKSNLREKKKNRFDPVNNGAGRIRATSAVYLDAASGMCVNTAKFQMIFLGLKIKNSFCINIGRQKIKHSEQVRLLGVQIDNKLIFNLHVKELCQK